MNWEQKTHCILKRLYTYQRVRLPGVFKSFGFYRVERLAPRPTTKAVSERHLGPSFLSGLSALIKLARLIECQQSQESMLETSFLLLVLTYNSHIEGLPDNTRHAAFTYNGYWEQSFFRTWHLEIQTILLSNKKFVSSYSKRQMSFIYELVQKRFTRILADCWQDPNHCTISCCNRHLTGFKKDFSCLVVFCDERMIIIRTTFINFNEQQKCWDSRQGSREVRGFRSNPTRSATRKFVMVWLEQWELTHSNSLLTPNLEN